MTLVAFALGIIGVLLLAYVVVSPSALGFGLLVGVCVLGVGLLVFDAYRSRK